MKNKILLAWICVLGAMNAKAEDRRILVQERKTLKPLEALALPLAIPPLAVRTIALPFKAFADWTEKVHLADRSMDFFFNDERTAALYPVVRYGGEGGVFSGLSAFHHQLWGRNSGAAQFLISPEYGMDGALSCKDYAFIDGTSFATVNHFTRRKREKFFGVGNDAPHEEFRYEARKFTSEFPLEKKYPWGLKWALFGRFLGLWQFENEETPIVSVFPPSETIGFDDRILAGEFGGRVGLDFRNFRGTPSQGSRMGVSVARTEGEDSFDFFREQIFLSQFFRLFRKSQVLAVGGKLELVQTPGGGEVPVSLLPTIGGSSSLRGFDSGRFRDRVSLLLGTEYRYPIWRMADGVLFFEAGRVASEFMGLDFDDLHLSYGGGARFRTSKIFFFQILAGASTEEVRFVFSMNQNI